MKIVGVAGLGCFWALKWAWQTFFWVLMRTIHLRKNFYSSIKTVGATVLGGLWAL